jgi:hypothetical protein
LTADWEREKNKSEAVKQMEDLLKEREHELKERLKSIEEMFENPNRDSQNIEVSQNEEIPSISSFPMQPINREPCLPMSHLNPSGVETIYQIWIEN